MFDDDDGGFFFFSSGGSGGPYSKGESIATVIFSIIIIAIMITACVMKSEAKSECLQRKCEGNLTPMYVRGKCLCMNEAKKVINNNE